MYANLRQAFRKFVNTLGDWQSPPGLRSQPDWRVYAQMALPYLCGNEEDQQLGHALLLQPAVLQRINACSFTTEYVLTAMLCSGSALSASAKETLTKRIADDLLHYAAKDLQHHGYNDNHVTLATASLALGGELTGNTEAIEEARANLMNFRDTFLRRGFMHEMNDCYIQLTLYSTALVAEFARDDEIRELARCCEERIWADLIGHWHPLLNRKPGPSARDYTSGRLNPLVFSSGLWCEFGDQFVQPAYPPSDCFADEQPAGRHFAYNGYPSDGHWNLGFLARFCAHPYHVPESVRPLMLERKYPHLICGTHETGNFTEGARREIPGPGGTKVLESVTLSDAIPFSARSIFTYQYQERDWAMGTASQRMIGGCPNNNWEIAYRKRAPLTSTKDQGMVFCSFTINDKPVSGEWSFEMDPSDPSLVQKEDVEHFFDNGRYAAVQHERTSIMLYRPRVYERGALTSLATTIVVPLCFNNQPDEVWLGDILLPDLTGESTDFADIFIKDGPILIGIRPLASRPQGCQGPRIKVVREKHWLLIHCYSYQGSALNLSEMDLCRIGGGFLCEVATADEYASVNEFRSWFRKGRVMDDQMFFMRQVRYSREGLDLGFRWDVWADNIMYRALNGREYPSPVFQCSGVDPTSLPWLVGETDTMDHFSWAARQARRKFAPHIVEPPGIVS